MGAIGRIERTGAAECDLAGDDEPGEIARRVELDLPGIVDRSARGQGRAILDLDRAGVDARAGSGAVEHREGARGVLADVERRARRGANGKHDPVGVAGHCIGCAGRRDHRIVDAAGHHRTVLRGPVARHREVAVDGGIPGDGLTEHRDFGATREAVARHAQLVAVGEPEYVVEGEQGRSVARQQGDLMIAIGRALCQPDAFEIDDVVGGNAVDSPL